MTEWSRSYIVFALIIIRIWRGKIEELDRKNDGNKGASKMMIRSFNAHTSNPQYFEFDSSKLVLRISTVYAIVFTVNKLRSK